MLKRDLFRNTTNVLVGLVVLAAVGYVVLKKAPNNTEPPADHAWFQNQVVGQDKPVLVKFGAEWCGPCKMLERSLHEYQQSDAAAIQVVNVDVDQHPDLAQHYGIRNIPHSFVFYRGRVIDDRKGSMTTQSVAEWIKSSVKQLPVR